MADGEHAMRPNDAPRTRSAALAEVERALLAELDSTRFFRLLVDSTSGLFGALTGVWLVDGERVLVERITSVPGTFPVGRIVFGEGMTGQCASTRRGFLVLDYPRWAHALPRYVAAGLRQAMAQPLVIGDQLLGVLTVSRTGEGAAPFTDEDLAGLERLASLAALALRNATLYAEAERRREEAEALARVARILTEVHSVSEVAGRIVGSTLTLFRDCLGAGVAVPQAEAGKAPVVLASSGPLSALFPPGLELIPGGLVDRVVTEQRPISSTDLASLPRPDNTVLATWRDDIVKAGLHSAMAVPLSLRGNVIGVLAFVFGERAAFSGSELVLAQAFADQAALALENARLYEEAERRRHEAEVVARIARTLNASLNVDAILQQVVEGARELCRSDIARIALRDPASGDVVFRYWGNTRYKHYDKVRLQPGVGSLGGLVLMTQQPVRTDDWMADPRFSKESAPVTEAEGIVTQLAVPIRLDGVVEGLLYVDNRAPRPFTDRDESVLAQLSDHAATALRNAQLIGALQASGARLQALSSRLLEVQEAERRHLARELHDEVGQALTAVKINLQIVRRHSETLASRGPLEESLGMVDRILQGVRQMALDLRPSLLDDLGLAAALRWYVGAQAERAGLAAELVVQPLPENLSPTTAITCFRVVQEAVTNAIRHARARRLTVTVTSTPEGLELCVRDDGGGFDVAAARRHALTGASMGILGIEERVELAGGRSRIESVAGHGTSVRAWLP